jgi:hypothetical protein|tara:strand:+ start:935 stop:1051 length:117 start_codon:yes stop_codon:yes gene_type:complete
VEKDRKEDGRTDGNKTPEIKKEQQRLQHEKRANEKSFV